MIPLFILGGILVALSGKYTARLAVRSGGQALYTLGPDKSLPPGVFAGVAGCLLACAQLLQFLLGFAAQTGQYWLSKIFTVQISLNHLMLPVL